MWLRIKLRDQGADSVAYAQRLNTNLTSIDLGSNQISAPSAQSLASVLRVNTSLTSINLSENEIGDQGAQYLANALRVWRWWIGQTIKDDQAFADALRANTSLNLFSLRDDHELWDRSIVGTIDRLCRRNKAPVTLVHFRVLLFSLWFAFLLYTLHSISHCFNQLFHRRMIVRQLKKRPKSHSEGNPKSIYTNPIPLYSVRILRWKIIIRLGKLTQKGLFLALTLLLFPFFLRAELIRNQFQFTYFR